MIPSCLFDADDGVLFAREEKEMQRLLKIAQDWSIAERMTYNVGKCGVLQHPATVAEYQLCKSNIPVVSSYKYLGFPMTIDGIDYRTHAQTLADTVMGFLKFIQFDSVMGFARVNTWFDTSLDPTDEDIQTESTGTSICRSV